MHYTFDTHMWVSGTTLVVLCLPILIWWWRNFEPSARNKVGSDAYYMSPLMVFPAAGLFGGVVMLTVAVLRYFGVA